jgi:hypothetical protein
MCVEGDKSGIYVTPGFFGGGGEIKNKGNIPNVNIKN